MVIPNSSGPKEWAAASGAVAGAAAVSLANFLLHLLFARQLFHDGLYLILYAFYVPQGAWLGAFTGRAVAEAGQGASRRRRAGGTLIGASALLIIAALLFAFHYPAAHWDYLIGYFGVALVWALALIPWAIALMKSAPPAP